MVPVASAGLPALLGRSPVPADRLDSAMSAVKIAEAQIQTEKAQEQARLRKAIRLVMENPGNLLAAEVYLAVSKEQK